MAKTARVGVLLCLAACSFGAGSAEAAAFADGVIQHRADRLPWRPGPSSLPAGTEMAVLEGDPQKAGLFTLRLRVPAGAILPPHWHPQPERVTILEGQVELGFGQHFDEKALKVLPAGSYYVNPPRMPHFLRFPEPAVVQITTEGPWQLHVIQAQR